MSRTEDPASPRADAQRNRARVLAVARAAFVAGRDPSLNAIAREADVGIGTVYRHFATRESLIDAVYEAERADLCASAEPLLQDHDPVDALRTWMDRYAEFIATKQGVSETLKAVNASDSADRITGRAHLVAAVDRLVSAGVRDGSIRPDVRTEDVLTSLVGFFLASEERSQIARLCDLLIAGVRSHALR